MSQARLGKFIIGGVNFKENFFGMKTLITCVYSGVEQVIYLSPLIAVGVGGGKYP